MGWIGRSAGVSITKVPEVIDGICAVIGEIDDNTIASMVYGGWSKSAGSCWCANDSNGIIKHGVVAPTSTISDLENGIGTLVCIGMVWVDGIAS